MNRFIAVGEQSGESKSWGIMWRTRRCCRPEVSAPSVTMWCWRKIVFVIGIADCSLLSPRATMASSATQSHPAAYHEPAARAAANPSSLTPPPSIRSGSDSGLDTGRPPKRRRINFACDYCRSRKTRCDEGQPSCYACSVAGIDCVTRNRCQPWLDVRRQEAGKVPDRTRMNDASRPGEHVSTSTVQSAAASLAIPRHEATRATLSPRRSRRQPHQANDTITAEAIAALPGIQGPSQTENDPVPIANSPGIHHDSQTHGTSSDPSDTGHGVDDRSELRHRLPILQIDSGNTPLELMASWLDLACCRLQIPRAGPRHPARSEEDPYSGQITHKDFVLPDSLGTWRLLDREALLPLVDRFLEGPNILFPLLQPEKIRHAAHVALVREPRALAQQCGLPVLMQVYLVMILGFASRPDQELDFDAEGYLKYSEGLLGQILQQSTLEALEAITLLSMALRCHGNLAAAGHTMSLAVSMSVSLGLPKYASRLPPGEERRNVWMGVFSFEKMLSFELGRSSLISDDYPELLRSSDLLSGTEQVTTTHDSTIQSREQPKESICEVVLSLAKLLGDIGRSCVQISLKEDDRRAGPISELIRDKVRTTGLSCMKLMGWASDVCPSLYNPTADILFDGRVHPFASFITMQYHTALILVMRNSLLISEKSIRRSVDIIAKDEPWEFAVRNGQSIAVNSARKILNISLESSENETYPALPSLAGPLHAMGVLAVFVATRQNSRMASMDRELLKAAAQVIKDANTSDRGEKQLSFAFNKLDALVAAARSRSLNGSNPSHRTQTGNSVRLPDFTINSRDPASSWTPQSQIPGNDTSLSQGSDEAFRETSNGHVNMAEGDSHFAYSEGWLDDSSPMIMNDFGWNWANFSLLSDGQYDESQVQIQGFV